MYNLSFLVFKEGVDFINVFSTTSPETGVVQSYAVLNKPVLIVLFVATPNPYCRATSDIIDTVLATESAFQTQKG